MLNIIDYPYLISNRNPSHLTNHCFQLIILIINIINLPERDDVKFMHEKKKINGPESFE